MWLRWRGGAARHLEPGDGADVRVERRTGEHGYVLLRFVLNCAKQQKQNTCVFQEAASCDLSFSRLGFVSSG